MDEPQAPSLSRLTTTQIGAIGEAVVAAGLVYASGGRISPFKPFADDDGTDLLIFDKRSKRAVPLQIKCRTGLDKAAHGTVQFDVRLKTFTREGNGFLLAALLDGASIGTSWLIPAATLPAVAREKSDKLVIVPSPSPDSNDRYRGFRHADLASVARSLLAATARHDAPGAQLSAP